MKGVLREYLEGRKKEVIDIMITLFDDDYILKMYALTQEVKGVVETYKELGFSIKDVIHKVAEKFNFPEDTSEYYVNEFWKN